MMIRKCAAKERFTLNSKINIVMEDVLEVHEV